MADGYSSHNHWFLRRKSCPGQHEIGLGRLGVRKARKQNGALEPLIFYGIILQSFTEQFLILPSDFAARPKICSGVSIGFTVLPVRRRAAKASKIKVKVDSVVEQDVKTPCTNVACGTIISCERFRGQCLPCALHFRRTGTLRDKETLAPEKNQPKKQKRGRQSDDSSDDENVDKKKTRRT
ncbi:hypothetical protein C8J56DRAFT_1029395 [Mycena floridula]|nr:hypothetical protein C8J56DRAFT_1029395 [Mycena floridula]